MSSLLVFKRVYRLEIQSVMLVLSNPVNYRAYRAPLPSLQFTSPPPIWVNKYRSIHSIQCVSCVTGGADWIMGRACKWVICTLCIWPDSKHTKLLRHPKQKPGIGGGLRQINTCRQVPLLLGFGVFIDIWSIACTKKERFRSLGIHRWFFLKTLKIWYS